MTPAFISGSIVIFSLVVGVPVSTNAEPVKVMDEASTDGSFTIAQTNGVNRRQDRRETGGLPSTKRGCWRGQAQLQTGRTPNSLRPSGAP